jgi:predicted Rossmann fold nucleotide-binding protein DprA/Smf involved in DNA uptake
MSTLNLSDDATAILLICGEFGRTAGTRVSPLSLMEYNRLAHWLRNSGYSPKDLVEGRALQALTDNPGVMDDIPRLKHLLGRGASLAFAVERWTNKGIWLVCRSDEAYPKRLRSHLGSEAPPILYGIGPRELVDGGGLAMVGSRNLDPAGADFAVQAATRAADQGLAVISGGARGVDQTAMQAALDNGGSVIGVLAEGILKKSLQPDMRQAIRSRRLALVSSFQPETVWKVYQAINRNKIIYALSDFALVVSADFNKGGTWQGATEELRRKNHIPVLVRTGGQTPKGNGELLKKGGLPLRSQQLDQTFAEILSQSASVQEIVDQKPVQADLFGNH